jgi:hypothetical protein
MEVKAATALAAFLFGAAVGLWIGVAVLWWAKR